MPHVYGIEHFLYLFVVLILYTLGFYFIKKYIKTEKQVSFVIKAIGVLLLLSIIWNRISIAILRDGWDNLLPATFCGATSLALSLSAIFLRKDHPVFHSVAFIGFLGGLITLIYPDFIGQSDSIFYPMTISGLWHHTVMVFLVLVMIWKGYLVPTKKKWYLLPLGLAVYMMYGIFLITELGYNDAMYIYEPILEGTKLNWFVLGVIFLPYHFIFVSGFDYFRSRK